MNKRKKHMIYEIDYLKTADFTDDDLHYLFDTPSLKYSLIVDMFKTIGKTCDSETILTKFAKETGWTDKYTWTYNQYKKFLKNLISIYMNLYQSSTVEAESRAKWWLTLYGFKISNYKFIPEI